MSIGLINIKAALVRVKNIILIFWKLVFFSWIYRAKIVKVLIAALSGKRLLANDIYLVLSRFVSQGSIRQVLAFFNFVGFRPKSMALLNLYTSYKLGDQSKVVLSIFRIEALGGISAKALEFHFFREILSDSALKIDGDLVGRLVKIASPEDARLAAFFLLEKGQILPPSLEAKCRSQNSIFNIFHLVEADLAAIRTFFIREARTFEFSEPRCFLEDSKAVARSVSLPKQLVWAIEDASLIGGFQILQGANLVVYEAAADPRNGFVAGIWKFVKCLPDKSGVVVNFSYGGRDAFDSGILISGRCSSNYFHWLIEDVPKVVNVLAADLPRTSPLVVQRGMYMQHHDFINFIAAKFGYPVLEVDIGRLSHFNTLYVPSPIGFHPDDPRFEYWEAAGICVDTVLKVREWGLEYLASSGIARRPIGGRYYLSRRGNPARGISNEDEVERVAARNGFEVVHPEKLSFVEQVDLFYGAEVIVSPAGAALANVIFCQSSAKIYSLLADINRGFSVQANLAKAVGCSFEHVTGTLNGSPDQFTSVDEYRFSGFSIDINKIDKLFSNP